MDILCTFVLRTPIETQEGLEYIAKSINNLLERRVAEVNLGMPKSERTTAILRFEAEQVKPNTRFKIDFNFPDDLDTINVNKTKPKT